MEPLDASSSRPLDGGPSFPVSNRIERALWIGVWTIFGRLVPPPLGHRWRRMLLRMFGAKIGSDCVIYPNAKIWLPRNLTMAGSATLGPDVQCYNMAPIQIGEGAIVSQRAFLCAGDHDVRDRNFQLITKPIVIGAGSWVAAEAYVAPGVTIGSGAVLAARGCAISDIPAETIWGGNPAKQIGVRDRHA